MSAVINTQLVESLAQAILALSPKEQALVLQKVQAPDTVELRTTLPKAARAEVDRFFQNLGNSEADPNQPTLAEIAQEVRQVRRKLRTQS